jgi:hypothetical protein
MTLKRECCLTNFSARTDTYPKTEYGHGGMGRTAGRLRRMRVKDDNVTFSALNVSAWLWRICGPLFVVLLYTCLSFQAANLEPRVLTPLQEDDVSQLVSARDPLQNLDPSNPNSHLSKILIPRPGMVLQFCAFFVLNHDFQRTVKTTPWFGIILCQHCRLLAGMSSLMSLRQIHPMVLNEWLTSLPPKTHLRHVVSSSLPISIASFSKTILIIKCVNIVLNSLNHLLIP